MNIAFVDHAYHGNGYENNHVTCECSVDRHVNEIVIEILKSLIDNNIYIYDSI